LTRFGGGLLLVKGIGLLAGDSSTAVQKAVSELLLPAQAGPALHMVLYAAQLLELEGAPRHSVDSVDRGLGQRICKAVYTHTGMSCNNGRTAPTWRIQQMH
jgi:hypothetical protein